ncbi:sensor histidine kinase [Paenibacillus sp. J2TS4]|nr:sensor histidine kinase [Paenibacillus sp. J2TS4]
MIGYGIVILGVVLLLGVLFVGTVRQYYYGSATQALNERAAVSARFYGQYLDDFSLGEQSRYIFENETDDFTRVEVIDLYGNLVIDSYGFPPGKKMPTPDINAALKGSTGTWMGIEPETKERILALSQPLMQDSRMIGILRYTTSIKKIDEVLNKITGVAVGVGAAVIFLSLFVSWLLARRIVSPIGELTTVAKHMAGGDFSTKAEKRYDDEVGHLAETLNYMADEIVRNEKLKNEFISSVSHELRTPLTSIKGWSETLISGGLEEKEETTLGLGVISKETDRLIGLVEDLLDFSKLQSGGIGIRCELVDVNRLMEEIGEQFIASGNRHKLKIEVQLGEGPLELAADRNRLKQVMVNLLDNAIKFTPEGGTIRLSTAREADEVRIQIADTGEGIQAENIKRVTEKFFKGTTRYPGSGLGLSICKEIVQLHRGRMGISSVWGEGTVVTIWLPIGKIEGKPNRAGAEL